MRQALATIYSRRLDRETAPSRDTRAWGAPLLGAGGRTFFSGVWRAGSGGPGASPRYHTCLSMPSSERWSSVACSSSISASPAIEELRTAAAAHTRVRPGAPLMAVLDGWGQHAVMATRARYTQLACHCIGLLPMGMAGGTVRAMGPGFGANPETAGPPWRLEPLGIELLRSIVV